MELGLSESHVSFRGGCGFRVQDAVQRFGVLGLGTQSFGLGVSRALGEEGLPCQANLPALSRRPLQLRQQLQLQSRHRPRSRISSIHAGVVGSSFMGTLNWGMFSYQTIRFGV